MVSDRMVVSSGYSPLAPDIILDANRVNPFEWEQLHDLIYFCHALELSYLWDERWYGNNKKNKAMQAQIDHILVRIFKFQTTFSSQERLRNKDGQVVNAMQSFFEPSLVQFSVSLYKYKQAMKHRDNRFSLAQFKQNLEGHFSRERAGLLTGLMQEMRKPIEDLEYCDTLVWGGDAFEVVHVPHTPIKRKASQGGGDRKVRRK